MATNKKPVDKRHVSSFQKQKRNSINQTDLSTALAFLNGDALNQACSMLLAQTHELFEETNKEDITKESVKSQAPRHTEESETDTTNTNSSGDQQGDKGTPANEKQSQNYVKSLSALYHKCKRAHDIIKHADELGQLDRPSGMHSVPSSPHPNTTPRSTHATPGVVVNSMPPPPPPCLSGNTNMPTPSLHRRSISGTNASQTMANNRLLFRRKPSDLAGNVTHTSKLQRSSSNTSDASKPANNSANPPEAVLNFLKKLNANGAADEGNSNAAAPISAMNREKKRKATSSPTDASTSRETKRPPPPPPRPDTTPITKSTNFTNNSDQTPSPEDAQSSGRRSKRSASKRPSSSLSKEKIHEVGESVMVKDGKTWYAAIVKDVELGGENCEIVTYEVEFDNGEINSGIVPADVREYDENH